MALSLENKQGGELKRWSLSTAPWPGDTEAIATCEQCCNIPLGMFCSVWVHTLLFVFQWYRNWNVTVLCLNVCLCVFFTSAFYRINDDLHAKWKHSDRRNIVWHKLFCHICIAEVEAKTNVPLINVRQMQKMCLWIFAWLTNWSGSDTFLPMGTVLPEATAVTLRSDYHFTSQPRPWPQGVPSTLTALSPQALFWELKSHNCRADSDS